MPQGAVTMPRLTEDERNTLLPALDGWTFVEGRDAIHKTFVFGDFNEAFGWMTRVAIASEKRNHHPEWSNTYKRVEVTLTSHSANGLTRADIELAQEMDRLAAGAARIR